MCTVDRKMECNEYQEEREELEKEIIRAIGRDKWERAKENENKGIEIILGIEEEGKNCIQGTKKYLRKMWGKRKRKEEKWTEKKEEHTYCKKQEQI